MSEGNQVFEQIEPQTHLVQLYEADEHVLTANVSRYLWEGLKRGEGILVIATPEHRKAFIRQLEHLGADLQTVACDGRLVALDAQEALENFTIGGQPDWARFENTIAGAVVRLQAQAGNAGVRAYGEMVGLLWETRQFSAAMRVEEFWNKLLSSNPCKLYCAYPIDVFGKEFHAEALNGLLCAHTHLIPAGENGQIESAVARAIDEVLGPDGRRRLKTTAPPSHWAVMPNGEAVILSLKTNAPEVADEVLALARQHYQTERRFRALIENSCDGICLLDAQCKTLYASASTTRVLGYEPAELIGQNFFTLISPDDAKESSRAHRELLANPRCPVPLQMRMLRKDGQWCWVESTSSNLLNEADLHAIVVNFRDISERKLAEEERQQDAEKLARSNAELQAFAYAVAHDLKEPLRTVCAFTQLLVRDMELDETHSQFAGNIVGAVTRMSALLDDLLSLTGLSFTGPLRPIPLQDAAEAAINNLQQAIQESGATITIDPLPVVAGNESHLILVFQNLLSNAIKYRRDVPLTIHIAVQRLRRKWLVKVEDNGIGVAPEHHDQIFGLFKRLHGHDIPGTGIGLALCKKIVEGVGGKIWLESELGKGSSFCFTIPATS